MKARNIFAALLLLMAGLQTAGAQKRHSAAEGRSKIVLYMDDHQSFEYDIQHLDSIVFFEADAVLVTEIVLSETSLTLQPNESMRLMATVLPADANNKTVAWSSSNDGVAQVIGGLVVAVAKGSCTVTCSATDGSGVRTTCSVTVADPNPQPDEHEWVDLGLPSGTLWAMCNVGANSPEEFGDYFAWGETQPKEDYSWNTYKYCMGNYETFTKYCSQSSYGYNGFSDTLTELSPEDDAATVNWGSSWQMPSLDQIDELLDNTTSAWIKQDDIQGWLFTAGNGKTLFLPAAGYRYDMTSSNVHGHGGYYWSRTFDTVNFVSAKFLYFYKGGILRDSCNRQNGLSVRPVRVQN